jgi:histidinol-phosphate aminotransferase
VAMDLTWTGSQFLDPRQHSARVLEAVRSIDVTRKDEAWAAGVADAAAEHFGLPAGSVRVTAGATQMLDVLLRSLYRGLVVDVVPTFPLTETICRQEGWNYQPVPVREQAELLPALEPYLAREDAVISLSSPRNPLGYQFSLRDIEEIAGRAAGAVIVDEVYADFAPDSALRLLPGHPRLFVVRTFSKAWGLASMRAGFGASLAFTGRAAVARPLRFMPNSVSGMAQRAVRCLLANPGPVADSIARAREHRDLLCDSLAGVGGLRVWPSHANYVCVETPLAAQAVAALAAAGYHVRALHDLGGYPPGWPPGLRITVPPQPHLDAVVACLRACHDPAAAPVATPAGGPMSGSR